MITDSYDIRTPPIMTPSDFYGPPGHLCSICAVTFSHVIVDHILASRPCEQIAEIRSVNGATPIYAFSHRGRTLGIYLSPVGSAMAAGSVLEVNWLTGAGKFILFGSAGSLCREKTQGRYVVPTAAYRDEGMSYHYAPPADYIAIPGAEKVAEVFCAVGAPYVQGRVWTTDAFYRETRGQMEQRVREGCIAVEMELAGVQAVCDFHGLELYPFLVTGDVLDQPQYSRDGLHRANHGLDKFDLALEIAARL